MPPFLYNKILGYKSIRHTTFYKARKLAKGLLNYTQRSGRGKKENKMIMTHVKFYFK